MLDLVCKVRFPDFGGRTCLGLAGKGISGEHVLACCDISPFAAVGDGTVVPLSTGAFASVDTLVINALSGALLAVWIGIALEHYRELDRSCLVE